MMVFSCYDLPISPAVPSSIIIVIFRNHDGPKTKHHFWQAGRLPLNLEGSGRFLSNHPQWWGPEYLLPWRPGHIFLAPSSHWFLLPSLRRTRQTDLQRHDPNPQANAHPQSWVLRGAQTHEAIPQETQGELRADKGNNGHPVDLLGPSGHH